MAAALCPDLDSRARVVAEARRWLGTPYCHQASALGAGADCLGLVRGVRRALTGAEPAGIPAYGPDWGETRGNEPLWQAMILHLPSAAPGPVRCGQVLLMRMRPGRMAKHLGIVTATDPVALLVHAYGGHGVVESPLGPWLRRAVARFELI